MYSVLVMLSGLFESGSIAYGGAAISKMLVLVHERRRHSGS